MICDKVMDKLAEQCALYRYGKKDKAKNDTKKKALQNDNVVGI